MYLCDSLIPLLSEILPPPRLPRLVVLGVGGSYISWWVWWGPVLGWIEGHIGSKS